MADIQSLSPELLHDIFSRVCGREGFTFELVQVCQVCHHWNVIAAPLLYERIWLASTRQLSMLIRTIINHYGKPLSVATWIQDLDVTCLNDTMDEWEGIYTLIRHTTALATIELGEHSSPSVLVTLTAFCASTLTRLSLTPSPSAMPGLTFISDLHNLRSLLVITPTTIFHQSYDILPWSLPKLTHLVWETAPEESTESATFIFQCHLPSISDFKFRTIMAKDLAAIALVLLLKNYPNIETFGVHIEETGYETLFSSLPTTISQLWVYSLIPSLIQTLPQRIKHLRLICMDGLADMPHIYDTLGEIQKSGRLDISIHFTFKQHYFEWKTVSPDIEQIALIPGVDHGELVRRLLWYSIQGLEIRDDNGKTIKECLP